MVEQIPVGLTVQGSSAIFLDVMELICRTLLTHSIPLMDDLSRLIHWNQGIWFSLLPIMKAYRIQEFMWVTEISSARQPVMVLP